MKTEGKHVEVPGRCRDLRPCHVDRVGTARSSGRRSFASVTVKLGDHTYAIPDGNVGVPNVGIVVGSRATS
jgi:hypothetical protein